MLFTMVAYEKSNFQSEINNQDIFLKNSIAQLYFILRTSELCWNCYSIPRDGFDIHRFPVCHVVRANFLLEDHGISEPYLGML